MKIKISQIKYSWKPHHRKNQLEDRLSGLNDKTGKLECFDKHKDKILRKYEQNI